MERSIFSARCFLENMKRTNMIQEVEAVVLEKWYDWCVESANIRADLIGTLHLLTKTKKIFL